MRRRYKQVGLKPEIVKVVGYHVVATDLGGRPVAKLGPHMYQIVTPEQGDIYAITLTTNDKKTFNRLLKRLGADHA